MVRLALMLLVLAATIATPARGQSIREMVEVADLSSVAISPDGRHVAYREERASVDRNDYALDWIVVPIDASAPPRRIAPAGEGVRMNGVLLAEPPIWTPDSKGIVYRMVADGAVQLWEASIDGGGSRRLTDDPANVVAFVLDPETGFVTYRVGATRASIERAERDEYDNGVLINASVDPAKGLYRNARIDGRAATSRISGFWFATAGLLADSKPKFRTLDRRSGRITEATHEAAARVETGPLPFDRLGDRQILARASSGDRRGTAYVLAAGLVGEIVVERGGSGRITCGAPCSGATILSLGWQGSHNRILFAATDGSGNHALHQWDIDQGSVRTVAGGKGTLGGGRDGTRGCAVDSTYAVCVAASANEPPRLERITLTTGARRTLAKPNAVLARADVLYFVPYQWTDKHGRQFTAQFLAAAGKPQPVPLFITYYACDGYLRGGTGDEFPLRQLAASGIAVLCINRAPAPPGLSDQAEHYRVALGGVASAIDRLAGEGRIDRRRVGMGGLSFGGEVTMWTAMQTDLLAAAAIATSLMTPTYYWFSSIAGHTAPDVMKAVWGLGDPDRDPARWREVSPALNADRIRAPLLMQIPEQEYRFNVELLSRLSRSPTPVEMWAFPDETHVKFQPRHKAAVYARNLDWFRYWLQGYIDPDPTKAEQYRRWQAFARKPVADTGGAGLPGLDASE